MTEESQQNAENALAEVLAIRLNRDGFDWVIQALRVYGRTNTPRPSNLMHYAAQDYARETPVEDRTPDGIIDAMLNAPPRKDWPSGEK